MSATLSMKLLGGFYLLTPVLFLVVTHGRLCLADFVFEIQVLSITTSELSDCGGDDYTSRCETYLSFYCLREGRDTTSNSTADCPLGYYDYDNELLPTMYIVSDHPWPVGC